MAVSFDVILSSSFIERVSMRPAFSSFLMVGFTCDAMYDLSNSCCCWSFSISSSLVSTLLERAAICDVTSSLIVEIVDVEGCHRLRKRPGDRNSPTIIRFTNRKISELCKRNKWKLKKLRYNNWWLSFREDLNDANNEIYSKCEELRSNGLLAKVYTHNGVTKVVKNEGDWAKKIPHMRDLYELMNGDDHGIMSSNR